jgi:hypothetical protein
MDPTQPLNLVPQAPTTTPYTAPNNPYQQMGVGNVVKALQAGLNGAQNSMQQGGNTAPQQTGAAAASSAPNFGQAGGQMVNHLANIAQALGGSSPAFGGGNLFSGDAWGGSAAIPLPGLDTSDYG